MRSCHLGGFLMFVGGFLVGVVDNAWLAVLMGLVVIVGWVLLLNDCGDDGKGC